MVEPAFVRILTFKEGVLSRLAHDLQLTVERFELRLDHGSLEGEFSTTALRVDGAVVKGVLDRFRLSADDRKKITRNIDDDVLATRRHSTVNVRGQLTSPHAGKFVLDGTLRMMGRELPFLESIRLDEGRLTARVTLVPSRWGIAPFRAPLGAFKLQDRVIVEVELATDAEGFDPDDPLGCRCRWGSPASDFRG